MRRFKNILVVANDDGLSDVVTARARWLARDNAARLTVLTVKQTGKGTLDRLVAALPGRIAPDLGQRVEAAVQEDLDEIADTLSGDGPGVARIMATGVGFIETIRQVLSGGHDLVLKGAEQSFDWSTLGGADLHLLRKCPCPVWILKSGPETAARRIMAAVDPDPRDPVRDALGHEVMQLATSLAARDAACLDVLNAWHLPEEHLLRGRRGRMPPDQLDALLEATRRRSRARLDALTAAYTETAPEMNVLHIKGRPDHVIAHHADEQRIDTLVMGTLGRSGLPGMFIGNTAETVLNRVRCSVLAVKPESFVSPVRL